MQESKIFTEKNQPLRMPLEASVVRFYEELFPKNYFLNLNSLKSKYF